MLADSTAQEAHDIEAERWLAGWLERPHRALSGQRLCELHLAMQLQNRVLVET